MLCICASVSLILVSDSKNDLRCLTESRSFITGQLTNEDIAVLLCTERQVTATFYINPLKCISKESPSAGGGAPERTMDPAQPDIP